MQTPIETGSPAAAWHLICQAADWLAHEAIVVSAFWQTLLLVGLTMFLVSFARRWAGKAAQ
jgi:hypothetical protein